MAADGAIAGDAVGVGSAVAVAGAMAGEEATDFCRPAAPASPFFRFVTLATFKFGRACIWCSLKKSSLYTIFSSRVRRSVLEHGADARSSGCDTLSRLATDNSPLSNHASCALSHSPTPSRPPTTIPKSPHVSPAHSLPSLYLFFLRALMTQSRTYLSTFRKVCRSSESMSISTSCGLLWSMARLHDSSTMPTMP